MKTGIAYFIFLIVIFAGCQNNYYTSKDYLTVLKIDSHVHINSDRGYFEDQAIKDNFRLITLNVDHSDSTGVKRQLDYALISTKRYPGKVFYAATFHFDTAGWEADEWSTNVISQLNSNIPGGAVSVKIWKNIGMTERDRNGRFIMINDPLLEPVIDFIISKNLSITGHLGEPRNCWLPLNEMTVIGDSSYFSQNPQYHMFLHPEYPSYEDQINARDNMLEKHPDLKFIGCHLGSLEWNVDELAKRLDKFPNMTVEMAARICHLQYQSAKDRERVRDFCIKYQDRLLYGTDLEDNGSSNREELVEQLSETWLDDWKYFTSNDEMTSKLFKGKFEGLQLPKEVINKIYRENAIKWYNLLVK
ncbi:MAG TPA: amidohydrolase family protein [Bacteroidales bacterium]|nr:amidohydrolase family protein [Bacteroidales bacterium]